jgi:hypothetical protein
MLAGVQAHDFINILIHAQVHHNLVISAVHPSRTLSPPETRAVDQTTEQQT